MPNLLSNDGAYAAVFDVGDGTVVKAYRRQRTTNLAVGEWCDHEAIIKATWANEVRAYEKLMSDRELVDFVPQFHGRCDPLELIPSAVVGSLSLVRGCGLRLEKLNGTALKLTALDEDVRTAVKRVLWQILDAAEPGNVWDSSCFVPGSRAPFTIIDFALWDGVDDFSEPLERCGRLSDHQRSQLDAFATVDDSLNRRKQPRADD